MPNLERVEFSGGTLLEDAIMEYDHDDTDETKEGANFEDVLRIVGNTGRFQLLVYIFFLFMEAAAASVLMIFVFDSINPGFVCPTSNITSLLNNGTGDDLPTSTNETTSAPQCQANGQPCAGYEFIGPRITVVSQFALVCEETYAVKMAQSVAFVGVLIGAAGSQFSDLFGRKRTLIIIWPLLMVTCVCQKFTMNFPMFMVIRFLSCVCVGLKLTVTTCLTVEYFGPFWRSVASCRIGFQCGELIADLFAFLLTDWKNCALAIGLFSAPVYPIFILLIPESPRWLVQKGRIDEAYTNLCKIARWNRKPKPDIEMVKRIVPADDKRYNYNVLHLYSTRKLIKTSLIVQFSWTALSFLAYGIASQMSTLAGSVYINFAISKILTIATRWGVVFVLNWCGRKKTFIGTWIVMVILFIVIISLDLSGVSATNRLPVSYIAAVIDSISNYAWSSVLMLSSELYPTLIRNVAIGSGNLAARIGSIFAPQIASLETIHMTLPFAVYAGLGVISMILIGLFIPETNKKPLPDELPPVEINCCASCRKPSSSSSLVVKTDNEESELQTLNSHTTNM
ncbi:solute carrier family 22 member 15-like [Tubulanus polymorphus]|uniref:solute carrier family 22 member 15-like n=1 Tax=Tubulanus polymorphus TaxID=672921 RepID=UPI003DA2069D